MADIVEPKTPREYFEVLREIAQSGLDRQLPEGDGIHASSESGIRTYTDLFLAIVGCSTEALEAIAKWQRLVNT